ncbi:hypothetical protein A3F45_01235 [Candidatus Curtissbacteria bacterium RIFCSPHIGHO2_12_FULL_41_17]|uniref:Histidinol-phosphatase n=2 Tax=Candidatus Curtissiibacteriota TaxID=1752717 RepID=A0A1F5HKS6_9BACT|nr:MAG: hypothetical protein A2693_00810 [Candidatus Curtissbacteria bacterium RIFCSPHIGHO2_01_FULL_40_12]OGE04718.1 MAG: hypothetical protein A3F45_01235 [Candidatus Curtissbacteria bacterium RIFCSPHIGHO2_12_FULL_41_17]
MLDVAIEAAKAAGQLAYRYFKTQPKVSYKADNSPVTRADIEAEKLTRKIVLKKFPDHGFYGEETGETQPHAPYKWVVDPIDGTQAFIRGISLWMTLVALLKDGKPIIGISYSPSTGQLFVAEKSKGTYLNGKKTRVSKIKKIDEAFLVHGGIKSFKRQEKLEGLINLTEAVKASRGWTDGGYNLLLDARADIYVSASEQIYDIAAPSILVEEAGGKFTDFDGKFSLISGNGVATNGFLHNQVLKILNS